VEIPVIEVSLDAMIAAGYEPVDLSPQPLEALMERELCEALREAVAKLPQRQREAILLRFWGGKSYVECADMMGIQLGTFQRYLFRAVSALRMELDAVGYIGG